MSWLDDPAAVRSHYAQETRLQTRMSIWRPPEDGITPQDVAVGQLRARSPGSLLEIGCGTGLLAERLAAELPGCRVLATDQSERMVELTRNRGVRAQPADAQALPFGDQSFDAVVAAWMLYHLADLDQGLAEVRRVLRPGGVFVAITNGDQHTADLRLAAGGQPKITGFSRENGEQSLGRHFDQVSAQHLTPYAIADHQQAKDYLASFDPSLAANLPAYEGRRRYAGAVTVFTAR